MNKKSIIEWVRIKEDKDLPPAGEYLVMYGDGMIKFVEWVPKTISFDWGWFDINGDLYSTPQYYCKLENIIDYEI